MSELKLEKGQKRGQKQKQAQNQEQNQNQEQEQKKERADYDGLWKDAIERFLPKLLERVLPDLYADIDFSVAPEFLSQELRDSVQRDNRAAVFVDELIKLRLKDGKYAWILLHIEVQGSGGNAISVRMFHYMTLIYAHHRVMLVALAILTSSRPSEVIGEYSVENHYGTKLSYKYNCFEVYAQDDDRMLQSDNPFDLIFYAVKQANKYSSQNKDSKGIQSKKYALLLSLTRMLATKGWNENDRRDLFSFIVRAVNLTDTELQQKFVTEFKEGENNMAELTFVEKYFRDEGIMAGESQWRRSEKLDTARRLRSMGFSDNDIFRATELPIEEISAIR